MTGLTKNLALCTAACVIATASGCGKKTAAPALQPPMPPPAASVPAQPVQPATPQTPAASAPDVSASVAAVAATAAAAPQPSTDVDNPTPLPAKEIKGVGVKQKLTYYYTFNAGTGTVKITATAKNAPSGATQALSFALQDAKANKLCSESSGNTTSDKTMTVICPVEKAQPLILRLDLSEETIDYTIALDGPVELPAPQAAASKQSAGAGSTDIDEPTRLTTNRVKGDGIKKPVSYYYAFNAGPGELTLTADGKNLSAATTNALTAGLYTLRSERLCEVTLGNTTVDKRGVIGCKVDKRQPVILRLDLTADTVDFRAKFEGSYDFNEFTPPKEVTIALDAAVLFDTGKFALKPEARQTLHEAAERVKKFNDAPVAISGHTDNVGSDASNRTLSEKRAASVQEYFTGQEGIPAARLAIKGYGKSQPIADNATEDGRARNRRVEIVISPKGK